MKAILFIGLISISKICFAQEIFYVLHIKGEVRVEDRIIKIKDKLSADDPLQFSSESAFIVVFSNTSGRKVIKPVNPKEDKPTLISYFVSENLFPVQNQLSTRGGDELRSFEEIKKFFSVPILVVDTLTMSFDFSSLGISESTYPVLTSGDLEVEGEFMDPNWTILSTDLSMLTSSIQIQMKDSDFGSMMPLCEVNLILKTLDEMKNEVNFYQSLTKSQLDKAAIKDHIETVYGRVDDRTLQKLIP